MKGEKLMEENTYKLGHETHGTRQGMVATLMQLITIKLKMPCSLHCFLEPETVCSSSRGTVIPGPTSSGGGGWCDPQPFPFQPQQTPTHIV